MITQHYHVSCDAPESMLERNSVWTARLGDTEKLVCTHSTVVSAVSNAFARVKLRKWGWRVFPDGRAYCPMHHTRSRKEH